MLSTAPSLEQLYSVFPNSPDRPEAVEIPPAGLPQPYFRLLVHNHHMTVTVEEFYRSPVDVGVVECRRNEEEYARKSLLTSHATGRVVQFGLVRINLSACSDAVRDEIIEGKAPLGRVLIRHNMLRRIEPVAYLRVTLSAAMAGWFGAESGTTTFGRVGVIYTGDQPAVEVLEILAPVPSANQPIGK
jgi:chorismate-pyruvate lyase